MKTIRLLDGWTAFYSEDRWCHVLGENILFGGRHLIIWRSPVSYLAAAIYCHIPGTSPHPLMKCSTWFRWWDWCFESSLTYISGHIRTVPACNREYVNHFIELSHLYITPQAHSVICWQVKLLWQRVTRVLCWTTLYLLSIRQRSFNYKFEIYGLTRPRINPGTILTWSYCSITKLPTIMPTA